jgi:AraC-like DNA-binding protein
MTTLLDAVRRYGETHADETGIAETPIPGLMVVRVPARSGLMHDLYRPLICIVVQGSKCVTVGTQDFSYSAGDMLLVTADIPTVSQITRASVAQPYLSLVLELNPTIIAELAGEMGGEPSGTHVQVRVDPTESEVADAALRLMRLLDRPASVPVLQAQLVREMHYWLLEGRHGPAIRQLGWPEGHVQRIARAVTVLRGAYKKPLPVEQLAAVAGMSPSSFHQHFRAVTTLSPLQFQKHLRLIEARRLMVSEDKSASSAAFDVGYESVSQFTREYRRMFGQPPVRDTDALKRLAAAGTARA